MVRGKKILLGVCGGIAAYKAAFLIRLLVKEGAEVQVVMTPDAGAFITPLTLSTLSGKPVLIEYFEAETGSWNNHVHLAGWADLILVAPITAHTLAKFAHGICDNLLTAVYLSAKSPVVLAPAMDLEMWRHGSTRTNIDILKSFGNHIVPPGHGELASGLVGEGRLAEPHEIFAFIADLLAKDASQQPLEPFANQASLTGKKVLVTAGPTYEAIDPVRFIGNHSSGKMGVAVAEELLKLGAEVYLVHGPLQIPIPFIRNGRSVAVVNAAEMLSACLEVFDEVDAVVMAAAVADFTPKETADRKIKKDDDSLTIELKRTTDILAKLGERKKAGQVLVGFALETNDELANAQRKLERKNLDFIVLNSLRDPGAGFGVDTNIVTILNRNNARLDIGLKSKREIAAELVRFTLASLQA